MTAIIGFLAPASQMYRATISKRVIVTVGLIVLILVSGGVWLRQDMRKSQHLAAEQTAQNLSIGLERDMERVISSYAQSLQGAAHALALPGFAKLSVEVKRAALFDSVALGSLNGLAIMDRKGNPVMSSDNKDYGRTNYSDRAWFTAQRDKADFGLYVGPPLVGKVSKIGNIFLSRRVNDAKGDFAGVVGIGIPTDFFQHLFSALKLDDESIVSLLTTDGLIVARTPFNPVDLGRDVKSARVFELIGQAKVGTYESTSLIDGVYRLYAYRQLGTLPFIVVVGLSERTIYAPWNRTMWLIGTVIILMALLGMGLGIILWRESTRRGRAEDKARATGATLLEADRLLRIIIETGTSLVYAKDNEGRILMANGPLLRHLGRSWSDLEGRTVHEYFDNAKQAEAVAKADRRIIDTGETQVIEGTIGQSGSDQPVWLTTKTPMRDATGRVAGIVGISIDITERRKVEDRLRLMVNELNHRVKNTLATVQAIITQTLRSADPAIRDALEGRLLALSTAHDVLTRESWESASIADVVANALRPFVSSESNPFAISGPPLRLWPRAALALSLGLHELATNAVKYGALSTSPGRVEVRWETLGDDDARFRFCWIENGGPAVVVPTRRGFGTKLLERILAQDLGGSVHLAFNDPKGLHCQIDAPICDVVARAIEFPPVGGVTRSKV
ncbi:HWE histidine kinase domain-containing protein (plasmid) [Rhizobium sp. 32-5/1]|uniref:sensor histidine kinase n=1 Tax=Rhizobium sp. 32-5/1 TaxID=3019602 RepID=UPI00240D9131|nr:cache domain-containing protein [Rhizobium sp. 32-5/1]WEZ85996.1 HWE histidine kinase domain-containing protein [Rhizobium sp. 32-5/1]